VEANEPTIQGYSQQLMEVFQKVLGPPEDQLEDDTREKLQKLVTH
jgi:importin-4